MINTQEIKTNIKGDIETDSAALTTYSHDASIFELRPEVVVYPKDSQDIQNIVRWVVGQKPKNPGLSITPRAAGTCMSGGSITESVLLDTTRFMNRTLEMGWHEKHTSGREDFIFGKDKEESSRHDIGYVWVQPGMYYRDFEKQTLAHGLLMPAYPASRALCAIGGMVGNNCGGEKSLSFGQCKDFVMEVSAVLSDGNEYTFGPLSESELEAKMKLQTLEGDVYRNMYRLISGNFDIIQKAKPTTSKNSTGYVLWDVWDKKVFNMAKIFAGSQGTLGVITKVKFKLVRPRPKSELLVMFLDDISELGHVVTEIKLHKPETFETFDDHTMKLALKYLPDIIKRMGGNFLTLFRQFLPELGMLVTGGLPKLVLLAEFTGDDQVEVMKNLQEAKTAVEKKFKIRTHITQSAEESKKYWTIRRESFNLLRYHSVGKITAPFIDDIAVHPEELPEFLPKLNTIFAKYPSLIYTIAGHAGDANFHIIPLMDLSKESERVIIPKLSQEVFDLVKEFSGTMSAEHNDGLVRGPYLEHMYGKQVTDLFREVKHIFDPQNIFNPHKKTDAIMEYSLGHIRRH